MSIKKEMVDEIEPCLEVKSEACDPLDISDQTDMIDEDLGASSALHANSTYSTSTIFNKHRVTVIPNHVMLEKLDVEKLTTKVTTKQTRVIFETLQCKACFKCFKTNFGAAQHAIKTHKYHLQENDAHQYFQKVKCCNNCLLKFDLMSHFENHVCTKSSNKYVIQLKSYNCKKCFEVLITIDSLKNHLYTKHQLKEVKNYKSQINCYMQCHKCFDVFRSRIFLNKHLENCKPKSETLICNVNTNKCTTENVCLKAADSCPIAKNCEMNLSEFQNDKINIEIDEMCLEIETADAETIGKNKSDQMSREEFENNGVKIEIVDEMSVDTNRVTEESLQIDPTIVEFEQYDLNSVKVEFVDEMSVEIESPTAESLQIDQTRQIFENHDLNTVTIQYVDQNSVEIEELVKIENINETSEEFQNNDQVKIDELSSQKMKNCDVAPENLQNKTRIVTVNAPNYEQKSIEVQTSQENPVQNDSSKQYTTVDTDIEALLKEVNTFETIKGKRTPKLSYICSSCNIHFVSLETFQTHIEQLHLLYNCEKLLIMLYECNLCYINFRTEVIFNNHICKLNNSKTMVCVLQYQCFVCSEIFFDVDVCNLHMTRDHNVLATKYKPKSYRIHMLQCKKCYNLFTTYATQCQHDAKVHDTNQRILLRTVNKNSFNTQRYKCTICGSNFSTEVEAHNHVLRSHANTRFRPDNVVSIICTTFQCNLCKLEYYTLHDITSHYSWCHGS